MSDTDSDADRRFAHNLFSGTDDDQAPAGKQKQRDRADDGQRDGDDDAEGRRFAADLFAPDDPEANVLAGLTHGKTVGRWQHPEREPEDRGPWFDRRPPTDDFFRI
ncbi:hypothetical protein Mycch_4770 [Mycolicibacterium chubuense NBB4]|uniref:Uncharacterized protein n=1 Tax=Mycolicibacterium chubuense (strain NBB4) TaxID=710421 RepID=I4BQB1_MYCCN|nr:hypothetical protein [Mycolicibacterium chubuense]AFM19468.1 hypothetical protein Mycch_4770 [Mycolicibacterium chubuense NBB4]